MEESNKKEEDTKHQSDHQKQEAKLRIKNVYEHLTKHSCKNPNCISRYCVNSVKRDLGTPEGEEPKPKELFEAAVKIVQKGWDTNMAVECPPEPLFGEAIDELLNKKDDKEFLSKITEVF